MAATRARLIYSANPALGRFQDFPNFGLKPNFRIWPSATLR